MIRSLIIFSVVMVLSAYAPAFAQNEGIGVTSRIAQQISYSQKVRTVVAMEKDPRVFSAGIDQSGSFVTLLLRITNELPMDQIKMLGTEFIRAVKRESPDAPPPSNGVGAGIYDYAITIIYASNKTALTGLKPSKESGVIWSDDEEATEAAQAAMLPEESREQEAVEERPRGVQSPSMQDSDGYYIDPLDRQDYSPEMIEAIENGEMKP